METRQRKGRATTESYQSILDLTNELDEKIQNTLLASWELLPPWLQDNHFIRTGYRPPTNSYRESLSSLAYLHNESVNIYSHFLGSLAYLLAALSTPYILGSRYRTTSAGDYSAFGSFFLGAIFCLGISAAFHAISNHSAGVASFMNKLDYVGIVLLIMGSFVPSIYYGFYCEPALQILYWTMVSSLGMGCTIVAVAPKFRTPLWRPYRASMFVLFGLSAVLPVAHGLKLYGMDKLRSQMGLSWVMLQGLLYVLGAVIYATRVPERVKPEIFDIFGSSHQIFHVLVLMASAAQLFGLMKAFEYRHGEKDGKC